MTITHNVSQLTTGIPLVMAPRTDLQGAPLPIGFKLIHYHVRLASGRFASYWNAFLLFLIYMSLGKIIPLSFIIEKRF